MIIRAFLLRATFLWLAARLLVTVLMLLAGAPIVLSGATTIAMVLMIVFLSWVEIVRRRERALIANLGVSLPLILSICAVPALLAEVFLNLASRLIS